MKAINIYFMQNNAWHLIFKNENKIGKMDEIKKGIPVKAFFCQ